MGNAHAAPHNDRTSEEGKVVLSNGAVLTYSRPLTVAELMLDHPREVVVEFHPAMIGKPKPAPLPADHALEFQKLYLMLPIRKGKPAPLSSEQARQILAKTASLLKTKPLLSYTGFLPLFVRICPAVGVRNDAAVLVEKKERRSPALVDDDQRVKNDDDYFTDILEGRPEFLSRQMSGKGWKPSLDTIKEKTKKAKVRHWVL